MPLDKKPGDSHAVAVSIPRSKENDVEDVSWALSTAEAMWGRGDRADAVKWVRRAAEAASEAEEDDRALELAKAAADLAQIIERGGAMPQPARVQSSPKINRNVQVQAISPAATAAIAPPQPRPAAGTRPSQSDAARKGRKSAHGLEEQAARASADPRKSQPSHHSNPKRAASTPEETRKRRSTIPPAMEAAAPRDDRTDTRTIARHDSPPRPPSSPPPSGRGTEPQTAEELESWPTQALTGDALSGLAEEMTRVSSPGYTEEEPQPAPPPAPSAVRPSAVPRDRPSQAPGARPSQNPGARPSQAMRVVVWRSADGVHVAPAGTPVSAITIEAVLVALDPGADLAGWLARK